MYKGQKQTFYADGVVVVDADQQAAEEAREAERQANLKQITEYYDHGVIDKEDYNSLTTATKELLDDPESRKSYDELLAKVLYDGKWKNDNYNAADLPKLEQLAKIREEMKLSNEERMKAEEEAKMKAEEAKKAEEMARAKAAKSVKVNAKTAEKAVKALLDSDAISAIQWHTFLQISHRLPKMTSLRVFENKLMIEEEDGTITTITEDGMVEQMSADGSITAIDTTALMSEQHTDEKRKKIFISAVAISAASMLIATIILLIIKNRKK